jgi:hypothetical protein
VTTQRTSFRRVVVIVAGLASTTACAGDPDRPAVAPPATAAVAPSAAGSLPPLPPGCGRTQVRRGGLPAWTASAGAPADLPYVLSVEGNLVGVLFGAPLHVPAVVAGRSNKILWIVREPRAGRPLHLTARPLDGSGAPVTSTEEADSGPGEIYPSSVDVPTPGCWHVSAEWDGHTATVDLAYGAG